MTDKVGEIASRRGKADLSIVLADSFDCECYLKSEFVCEPLLLVTLARNMTCDATALTIISVDILLTCFLLTQP